jgi:hypothetical protein
MVDWWCYCNDERWNFLGFQLKRAYDAVMMEKLQNPGRKGWPMDQSRLVLPTVFECDFVYLVRDKM